MSWISLTSGFCSRVGVEDLVAERDGDDGAAHTGDVGAELHEPVGEQPVERGAGDADTTQADVINAFIAWYLHAPGAQPVKRPDREVWAKPTD